MQEKVSFMGFSVPMDVSVPWDKCFGGNSAEPLYPPNTVILCDRNLIQTSNSCKILIWNTDCLQPRCNCKYIQNLIKFHKSNFLNTFFLLWLYSSLLLYFQNVVNKNTSKVNSWYIDCYSNLIMNNGLYSFEVVYRYELFNWKNMSSLVTLIFHAIQRISFVIH